MEEKVKEKEPKVTVFGHDVGDKSEKCEYCDEEKDWHFHKHFHHHHGSFLWGLVFILFGLWLLSANTGILPPVVWYQVSRLWPILIVIIGFDILIGHSIIGDIVNSLLGIFVALTIAGIVLIHTSPASLHAFPVSVSNYLYSINNYLQIK